MECPNTLGIDTLDTFEGWDVIQRDTLTWLWWFHLKHCVQVWNPAPFLGHKKGMDLLQRLHRRATGMMTGLIHLSSEERLREGEFLSLEKSPGSLIAAL